MNIIHTMGCHNSVGSRGCRNIAFYTYTHFDNWVFKSHLSMKIYLKSDEGSRCTDFDTEKPPPQPKLKVLQYSKGCIPIPKSSHLPTSSLESLVYMVLK